MSTLRLAVDPREAVAGAARAEKALEGVATQAVRTEAATKRVDAGLGKAGNAMAAASKSAGAMRASVQNASYQVGDFAVQIAAGTSASRAMAMQLPQLLGGFGMWGAAAGAVAAIMGALLPVLFKAGEDSKELSEEIDALSRAMTDLSEANKKANSTFDSLFSTFGANTAQAQRMLDIQRQLAQAQAGISLTSARSALSAEFGAGAFAGFDPDTIMAGAAAMDAWGESLQDSYEKGVVWYEGLGFYSKALEEALDATADQLVSLSRFDESLEGLAETLGVTVDAARPVAAAIAALSSDESADNMAALAAAVATATDGFKTGSTEAHELYQSLVEATMAALQLEGIDIASNIGAAADEAWRLKSNLNMNDEDAAMAVSLIADPRGAAHARAAGVNTKQRTAATSAASATQTLAEQYDRLRASLDPIYRATSEYADTQELLNRALSAGQITQAQYNETLAMASIRFDEATGALEDMASVASTIEKSMTSGFMSIIDGTKSAKDAFRDMARDIIAELYRVLVVKQLVGSWDSGTGSGTGIVGMLMGGLFGRASGGPVDAGKPYIVGERGPEVFTPSTNGRISNGGGGGVTIIQNNTFGNGVSRAEIQSMLPRIVETTKAAVFDAQRRSVNGLGYA